MKVGWPKDRSVQGRHNGMNSQTIKLTTSKTTSSSSAIHTRILSVAQQTLLFFSRLSGRSVTKLSGETRPQTTQSVLQKKTLTRMTLWTSRTHPNKWITTRPTTFSRSSKDPSLTTLRNKGLSPRFSKSISNPLSSINQKEVQALGLFLAANKRAFKVRANSCPKTVYLSRTTKIITMKTAVRWLLLRISLSSVRSPKDYHPTTSILSLLINRKQRNQIQIRAHYKHRETPRSHRLPHQELKSTTKEIAPVK